ncbi:hypothetical protein P8452_14357 [Trifolium repens]|nr:hypothetical protein P8452_14357 [Trifolium repens]
MNPTWCSSMSRRHLYPCVHLQFRDRRVHLQFRETTPPSLPRRVNLHFCKCSSRSKHNQNMQSSNVEGTKEAKTPLIEVQKDQVA